MTIPMTIEQFKEALPPKLKKSVNPELIQQITDLLSDPDMFENYRENLLGYTSVMQDGKFKTSEYINAVKYVSHKLMGCTNMDAYIKTFPQRYQSFVTRGVAGKDIASYVTAYNKSKLVNLIFAQTMVPSYVLNQDLYQKAINVQAELMLTATSEKVRTDAANSLLTHLKMPETQKVELDIGVKQDSSVDALRGAVMELVAQQKLALQSGVLNAKEVAGQRLTFDQEPQP